MESLTVGMLNFIVGFLVCFLFIRIKKATKDIEYFQKREDNGVVIDNINYAKWSRELKNEADVSKTRDIMLVTVLIFISLFSLLLSTVR